ncbi:hypothetical protein GALMADRAFT_245733 [Galerina marginata CBS 339.88]|uniref:Mucoidy inhibitor A n=1 Tax=Galerina marginata (strain CBS 339.88) TaxID=685588 RepID=A0A067TCG9_GALM3|nr:hypothetical protein GALMADRAFT_245733 [Galerina marginata CBS 339.88]
MTTSTLTSTDAAPPPAQPANIIELVSVRDSKITGVSVYSNRAEITRLFNVSVKTGQNQLNIVGLPDGLDHESLRVEGRGAATIHDVSISTFTPPPNPTTSPTLVSLLSKEKRTDKALARAQTCLMSLRAYLSSLKAGQLEVSKLREVVQEYDTTAGELDEKVTVLEDELDEIKKAIVEEKSKLAGPTGYARLTLKATVGVFADSEDEIQITLIYAVNNATWSAGYDIRVDMHSKVTPVALIYKAAITQHTGEDWADVPLTLETATPTFGLGLPTLTPWALSIYRPPVYMTAPHPGMPPPNPSGALRSVSGFDEELTRARARPGSRPIAHRAMEVSAKSGAGVSATFGVPGLMSVPTDGVPHSVTIARLALEADLSWVCVPKKDCRVNLKAKIKNASEYTLLTGTASIYVDGSFISKSAVPHVSPDESFDCPLGLDPSIRVTYHPITKKVSQSGFYSKSSNYTFSQRVTVHNTKSISSSSSGVKVKIVDQVPVSEDASITVKLVQPALTMAHTEGTGSGTASGTSKEPKAPPPVKVAPGVHAMWDGADDVGVGHSMGERKGLGQGMGSADMDVASLGKEGRFCWVCEVPPQGKVALVAQWEVATPVGSVVVGI